jgi:hypothetical protein
MQYNWFSTYKSLACSIYRTWASIKLQSLTLPPLFQDCGVQLTDEPDKRCYPLEDHLLCHSCHIQRIVEMGCHPPAEIQVRSPNGLKGYLVNTIYIHEVEYTYISLRLRTQESILCTTMRCVLKIYNATSGLVVCLKIKIFTSTLYFEKLFKPSKGCKFKGWILAPFSISPKLLLIVNWHVHTAKMPTLSIVCNAT